MTAREEARKRARLLNAWADKETLQYRLVGVWTDYDEVELPNISHSCEWRIKPRRMWTTPDSNGVGQTTDQKDAEEWRALGFTVTEWQEVIK